MAYVLLLLFIVFSSFKHESWTIVLTITVKIFRMLGLLNFDRLQRVTDAGNLLQKLGEDYPRHW
jgi:hypothetical protein